MPVPSDITALSTTAVSNSPPGSESPSSIDDYLRSHASFIAQLRAVIGGAVNANIPTSSLGVGQTWQDLTASRALDTTYTNSTGRPIEVAVTNAGSSVSTGVVIIVDGVQVIRIVAPAVAGGLRTGVTATVPNGSTYSATDAGNPGSSLHQWRELR